jgi:cytochrome c peroxidase
VPPLLTDFSYDNLGIPVNPEIAALAGRHSIDYGLGARPEITALSGSSEQPEDLPEYGDAPFGTKKVLVSEAGKFKVMSLRNIGLTAPYGHNGYFKTLQDIVHFYNTRDVLGDCAVNPNPIPGTNCWPAPEVAENVNVDELGNLGLTSGEEDDLVAFLKTFSDGVGRSPFGAVPVPPMP